MNAVRRNLGALAYLLIYQSLDILLSSVLFARWSQWFIAFVVEVKYFEIHTTLFELWVFSVVRTIVVYGSIVGFVINSRDAIPRIRTLDYVVLALSTLMWGYTLVKLLTYSEEHSLTEKSATWFWPLFAWSVCASIAFYINWQVLCKCKPCRKVQKAKSRTCTVNSIPQERESLVDSHTHGQSSSDSNTDDEEDEESNKKLNKKTKSDEESQKKKKKAGVDSEDDEDDETKPKTVTEKAVTVGKLLKLSRPDLPYILTAFFFMVVSCVSEIFTPFYTGEVIQGIAIDRDRHKFTMAIIYMSLFSFGSAMASGMRGWFFKIAMSRLDIRVRNQLFCSIVQQEIGFFDTVKTGDLSSRLQSDTAIMSSTLGFNTNVFVRSVLKAIGVVVFMVKISWRLSMVTLIGLPIITGFSKIYGNFYQKLAEKVQDAMAKANEVSEETCSSMRTVRSFASENKEADRYKEKMAKMFGLNMKEAFVYAGYMWSNNLFSLALTVATLYYGGVLVLGDLLKGGNLVSFILYQAELGNCIEAIGYVYTGLMQAVGASHKVFSYIYRKPKLPTTGKLMPEILEGKLEFRNVSFAYPSRPDTMVLKNVSFCVEPGEVVALVGPSGGGKSSCVNLLEQFYETDTGQVLLDGVPLQDYDHTYLHTKISLVGQEPVLFARTISENIAYGLDECSPEEIERAADMANAALFIGDMKEKYDTEAGEKGTQLSGGQKQRIAIARAIIRKPTVLLLDEATSALDSESEHVVQEAIYKNLKDRTVIIIAHRLSTVERASRIIVINKGEVVEQGSHSALLKQGGMYSRLVKRQLLGFEHPDLDPGGRVKRRNPSESSNSNSSHLDMSRAGEGLVVKDGPCPCHKGIVVGCSRCSHNNTGGLDIGARVGICISHSGDPIGTVHHVADCSADGLSAGNVTPFGTPKLSTTP